jgi:hypothetical protein
LKKRVRHSGKSFLKNLKRPSWDRFETSLRTAAGSTTQAAVNVFDPSAFLQLPLDQTRLFQGGFLRLNYRLECGVGVNNATPMAWLGLAMLDPGTSNVPDPRVISSLSEETDWLDLWCLQFPSTSGTSTANRAPDPSSPPDIFLRRIKTRRVLTMEQGIFLIVRVGYMNGAPIDTNFVLHTEWTSSWLERARELN